MDQNDREILLLNSEPGELISEYQGLIKGIVYKYRKGGFISASDTNDLIQEINRQLLERAGKIQMQYNGRSSLRTYFSVIVKNICRERFRKQSVLEEPQVADYYKLAESKPPLDNLLIREEYERFQKVIRLMFQKGSRFILIFRFLYCLKIQPDEVLNLNNDLKGSDMEKIVRALNPGDWKDTTKKKKYEVLSNILNMVEGFYTSPESLRKWYTSRCKECVDLMNGNPPRSAYTIETLQILVEKNEILKIVD